MNRKLVFAVLSIVCLAGTLVSATLSVGVYDQPAYMVVRGSDNGIYYRLFNEGIGTWGAWTKLPGVTCDSPSAAYIGDQLCVVVRGMDGSSMWQGFVNVNTGDFSGWTYLSGSTPSAVELGSASSPSGFEPTGNITIAPAAFVPGSEEYQYTINTFYLRHDGPTADGYYYSNLVIPNGVQITKMGFYWDDESSESTIGFYIYEREPGNLTLNTMFGIYSGDTGNGQTTSSLSNFNWITDNSQYIYSMQVSFSGTNMRFYGAFIEYSYPT